MQGLTFTELICALCPLNFRETRMPTRNLALTDHQAFLVEHLVTSGRHPNASEVLQEDPRLVDQRDAEETLP